MYTNITQDNLYLNSSFNTYTLNFDDDSISNLFLVVFYSPKFVNDLNIFKEINADIIFCSVTDDFFQHKMFDLHLDQSMIAYQGVRSYLYIKKSPFCHISPTKYMIMEANALIKQIKTSLGITN